MKRYSKAIAALVSAIAGFLVVQFPGLDGAVLESAVITILTVLGVYVAPANGAGPNNIRDMRTPWPIVVLALCLVLLAGCANFQNAVGAAYLARTTIAEAVTEECGNSAPDGPCAPESAISTADKDRVKAYLVQAGDYLADARAIEAGRAGVNCSDKWACLNAANGVLDAVERILIERGVE